jgi:uncharacterized protein (DUF1501 family)
MLDPDISTEDALALLSRRDVDDEVKGPNGWSRRKFLAAIGAGAFGGATIGSVAGDLFGGIPEAWGAPLGTNDGVLVLVTLYGGFDGLNVVVPYTDGTYLGTRRDGLRVDPSTVQQINGTIGLAPQLKTMKSMYDQGKVAIVQGAGYANPNLSHFSSMAIWMRGWLGGAAPATGWVGRWLDGLPAAKADLAAAALSSSVALHMQGNVRSAVGIPPDGSMFGGSTTASEKRMFATLRQLSSAPAGRGVWHDQFTSSMTSQIDLAAKVAPTFLGTPPGGGEFQRKLTIAARLLNADLGLRVLDVSGGGFDTHTDQNSALPPRLADIDAGLASFYAQLSPELRDRVTLMVFSEFGRTIGVNGTMGTDHGTTNPMFLIGDRVKGGLYGAMPSLSTVSNIGRMTPQVDFRNIYGSVLEDWMGGGASTVLGGGFSNFNLFNAGPGPLPVVAPPAPVVVAPAPGAAPAPVVAPLPPAPAPVPEVKPPKPARVFDRALPAGFVPCAPTRVVDTRDGTGGRSTKLGEGETWTLALGGSFGIPADATSVLVNVTTVSPTADTFLLVWSGDIARPLASSMSLQGGGTKGSLVLTKLSTTGNCNIYNNNGVVDVVIDLVGWFAPSSTLGITSTVPRRLLDTRDSNAPLQSGSAMTVPVRGWAGVTDEATVVAFNVTVTEPTDASYLAVWPGRVPFPSTSNLNMRPGDTVPNLVFTELGNDGSLNVQVNAGSTHVVLDVAATFAPDVPGRLIAIDPVRVVDTRTGLRASAGWDGGTVTLSTLGMGGVPAESVSALVLTVALIGAEADTHVSVYPSGARRPLASNVNVRSGSMTSNLVIAAVGRDGAVALTNNSGLADIVVDLVGYVTS